MDPGTCLSIVALAQSVLGAIYEYGDSVVSAKDEIAQLRSELFGLKAALEHMACDITGNVIPNLLLPVHTRSHEERCQMQQEASTTAEPITQSTQLEEITPHKASMQRWHMSAHSVELNAMLQDAQDTLLILQTKLCVRKDSQSARLASKLAWPLKKDHVLRHVAHLERLKTFFIMATTNDSARLLHTIFLEVNECRRILQVQLEKTSGRAATELQNHVRAWLTTCDPSIALHDLLFRRHQDTGLWLLDGPLEEWRNDADTSLFWLVGSSGTGKSTLTSACIERIQLHAAKDYVAYHFCTIADRTSQSSCQILGSLIAQLGDSSSRLNALVLEFYHCNAQARSHRLEQSPLDARSDLLKRLCQSLHCVYLFVDGLNESREDCSSTTKILLDLATECRGVKLFLSSTPSLTEDLLSFNRPLRVVDTDVKELDADIELFLNATLLSDKRLSALPSDLKQEIKAVIEHNADRSFRWTTCLLVSLSSKRTPHQIRTALRCVPSTLEDAYQDILLSIPKDDRGLMQQVFSWLCLSLRALTLTELAEVVAFTGSPDFGPEDRLIDSMDLARGYESMIRYDYETDQICLAHSSVRSWLMSQTLSDSKDSLYYVDETSGNSHIAVQCVAYLQLHEFQTGYCDNEEAERRRSNWPFYAYAAEYWSMHVHYLLADLTPGELSPDLMQVLQAFLADSHDAKGGPFGAWYQQICPHAHSGIWMTKPIYIVARGGITSVLRNMLQDGSITSLEQPGGFTGSTPLHIAAYQGNAECVRMLLDAGAEPNAVNLLGETALQWAKLQNYDDIVAMLETAICLQ